MGRPARSSPCGRTGIGATPAAPTVSAVAGQPDEGEPGVCPVRGGQAPPALPCAAGDAVSLPTLAAPLTWKLARRGQVVFGGTVPVRPAPARDGREERPVRVAALHKACPSPWDEVPIRDSGVHPGAVRLLDELRAAGRAWPSAPTSRGGPPGR
jgi:hypothetical protein